MPADLTDGFEGHTGQPARGCWLNRQVARNSAQIDDHSRLSLSSAGSMKVVGGWGKQKISNSSPDLPPGGTGFAKC